MIIVIKIGSQALLDHKKKDKIQLDRVVIASLVQQIAVLKTQGHVIYLISSGAVAAGRGLWHSTKSMDETAKRQILAGIGQVELMQMYKSIAREHGLNAVQILLTKSDFISRNHYLNLERLLSSTQQFPELLPIINENDSISVEELMFTDNDQLAGVLARQLGADLLLLLTEAAGIFDRDPSDPEAQRLPILGGCHPWPKFKLQGKNSTGRGGISSKLDTVRKMSRAGIISTISCKENRITQIVESITQQRNCTEWPEEYGTLILPTKESLLKKGQSSQSSQSFRGMKKWLSARHLSQGQARVIVNEGLTQKLKGEKQALSILPIGICEYRGQFSKGDLIDIYSTAEEKLGLGLARYNSEQLEKTIAKKNQSIFIHYNYLYIENWDLIHK